MSTVAMQIGSRRTVGIQAHAIIEAVNAFSKFEYTRWSNMGKSLVDARVEGARRCQVIPTPASDRPCLAAIRGGIGQDIPAQIDLCSTILRRIWTHTTDSIGHTPDHANAFTGGDKVAVTIVGKGR